MDVGFSYSIEAGMPDVLDGTFTASFDLSITSTKSDTVTTMQVWSVTQPIEVPAMTTIKAQLIIEKVSVTGDWSAVYSFPDYAKLWCSNRVNGHYEWFVPAQNWLLQAYLRLQRQHVQPARLLRGLAARRRRRRPASLSARSARARAGEDAAWLVECDIC